MMLYLVCRGCGEAFDDLGVAYAHDCGGGIRHRPRGGGLLMGDYNSWYSSGWSAAQRSADLEAAEARFLDRTGEPWNGAAHDAFEDGWMDWACGRSKFHLRDCLSHPHCDSPLHGPYPDPWGPGGKFIESGLERVEEDDQA